MDTSVVVTGNSGPKVRSDCAITLELNQKGGIQVEINSKVKSLYGESIKSLCLDILEFYGIKNCSLKIDDTGALPFVISARIEAAVKKLTDRSEEYLPELIPENTLPTTRDRFRLTRLYLPGNTPSLMINAGLHSPDGLILDLEDSVAPEKKDEARFLVRNALRQINFFKAERMVRINQGERGLEDLEYIVPHFVNLVLIPKCEDAESVLKVVKKIREIQERDQACNDVFLMPVIETAQGIENITEIARSSPAVVAIAIGLEDYTSDLGVQRTMEGNESFYARSRIVVAARAAKIQAIDSVFSDVNDMEGLRTTVLASKALGFEGMGCIHPRQIPVITEGFSPGKEEIERSVEIIKAFRSARTDGLGVVALGSKMIDAPVVSRAVKTLELAGRLGLIQDDWKDNGIDS